MYQRRRARGPARCSVDGGAQGAEPVVGRLPGGVGLAGVKFLGSYPAAGEHGPEQRRQADAAWQAADDWLRGLRAAVE